MDYFLQTPAQLSSHLRALRKAKGLSQAQLGALLGLDQTRIARIERNPAVVSIDQLFRVLSALGVRLVLRPAEEVAVASRAAGVTEPGAADQDAW
jgi:HTH-type transcriptional regulator / antitoxin HipB